MTRWPVPLFSHTRSALPSPSKSPAPTTRHPLDIGFTSIPYCRTPLLRIQITCICDTVLENKIWLAVAQKISDSDDVPAWCCSRQCRKRRRIRAVVQEPDKPLTGRSIFQDQVIITIAVEI